MSKIYHRAPLLLPVSNKASSAHRKYTPTRMHSLRPGWFRVRSKKISKDFHFWLAITFELVKDVALDGVKSELARHDRGDEKKVIFTNLGFANLPNQIYRKSVKDGFEFNLMVCGSSGLGKSTLMNSLFLTDIYSAVSTKNFTHVSHYASCQYFTGGARISG